MISRNKAKKIFFGLSVALTLLLLSFFSSDKKDIEKKASDSYSYLVKPFYHGFSDAGNKYQISSDNANQISDEEYSLKKVFFKYYQDHEEETYFTVSSLKGLMNDSTKTFKFYDDVEMLQSNGYRGITEEVFVNFRKMEFYTDKKFLLTSAKLKLSSEHGFINYSRQKKIFFEGPVKTIIYNQKL
ncbi:MAG: LPS export ABC transporter periplasmic protein LptC [Rickettsiales bacterium]